MNRSLETARSRPEPSAPAAMIGAPATVTPAGAAIHVHIGRVVIDAGAFDGTAASRAGTAPHDGAAARRRLEARLHAALAPLLGGATAAPPDGGGAEPERWVKLVAADIAARVRPLIPEARS